MRTTIYDVALHAGVSISTVSLALNSPNRVKPATLQRILAAADELQYVPKAEAVVRARRGVRRIGVMAPFTSYPSFSRRLNGVIKALRDDAWEIVLYDQESAAFTLPSLASIPLTNKLDGLIVMALPIDDPSADRILRQKLATVLVEVQRPGFSSVTIDDAAGGRLAARLLLERGHTRFGFIGEQKETADVTLPAESRLEAYGQTLAAAGHPLSPDRVLAVPHAMQPAREAAHVLLGSPEPPTAIFTHDDVLAGGVLKAARERGLRVPQDLAVIGFDDAEIAEHLGLTTIRQPLEESGEIAAETLVKQLTIPDPTLRHVTLNLTLVERETA
ncbi:MULTISPECIES: LacI family DNA-binding transcriptional regulator [Amycolatopsis]|uniref:LacI family transcriptional regulator n=2 Tax=Amycolatopsis TaxID=1813 RepID=A0A1I3WPU1_9PSEU|nr:LacI family DNA-binding transcriptional regulator [Amycolatopsis sacchari]SFK09548.1 LacI family transcriptional regulator [Amycolatopsis sacchari]